MVACIIMTVGIAAMVGMAKMVRMVGLASAAAGTGELVERSLKKLM